MSGRGQSGMPEWIIRLSVQWAALNPANWRPVLPGSCAATCENRRADSAASSSGRVNASADRLRNHGTVPTHLRGESGLSRRLGEVEKSGRCSEFLAVDCYTF